MALDRINAVIIGKVQGVFFRDCTRDEAKRLRLTGWVRNRPDGSVETEVQGDKAEIRRMLNWMRQGSPMSAVVKVIHEQISVNEQEKDFVIRY
jgi:acylphosphatase